MIDFHSHILPGIDDGSHDVKQSLAMLSELKKQRVDTVIASSHFYVNERSPRRFLEKRAASWDELQQALPVDSPEILLGAEVLYFSGISRLEELPILCIERTDVLLLEMPFRPWTEHMLREVEDLVYRRELTVLLAHIERYLRYVKQDTLERLLDAGVLVQANADFFLPFFTKRKALRMLDEGYIHVLGSDCHNTTTRAPRLAEAVKTIREHLGSSILKEMDELGKELIQPI